MTNFTFTDFIIDMGLLIAAAGFVLGLKYMSHPKTARQG